jgi:hypothetical protein
MVRRRVGLALAVFAAGLAAAQALSAAADGSACPAVRDLRYLDVEIVVTPAAGPAAQAVTLSAACLPENRPALVLRGQDLGAMQPVALGATDAAGAFEGTTEVPAEAAPGAEYYFALVIDDQAVGSGSFRVDGVAPATE